MDKQETIRSDYLDEGSVEAYSPEVCSAEFTDGCRHPEEMKDTFDKPVYEPAKEDIPDVICAPEFPEGCINPFDK